MMIYVKSDTYIKIMTKNCGSEGRNIVTFTVHAIWIRCFKLDGHKRASYNLIGHTNNPQYP